MKRGKLFPVERRSVGVSISCGQLGNWSTPTPIDLYIKRQVVSIKYVDVSILLLKSTLT